jgi:hypothetical protein
LLVNWRVEQIERQNPIFSSGPAFQLEKCLEFRSTSIAVEIAGREDWDQKQSLLECLVQTRRPVLAPGDAFAILEDLEVTTDSRGDHPLQSLAQAGDPATVGRIVATRIADERSWMLHGIAYLGPWAISATLKVSQAARLRKRTNPICLPWTRAVRARYSMSSCEDGRRQC